jgi:hypothetical protein
MTAFDQMDHATIRRALQALSAELGAQNIDGEICLLGGTAMVLAFQAGLPARAALCGRLCSWKARLLFARAICS